LPALNFVIAKTTSKNFLQECSIIHQGSHVEQRKIWSPDQQKQSVIINFPPLLVACPKISLLLKHHAKVFFKNIELLSERGFGEI